jgi:nicotinamide riboside kinase
MAAVRDWLTTRSKPVFRLFGFAGTGKTTLAKHLARTVNGIAHARELHERDQCQQPQRDGEGQVVRGKQAHTAACPDSRRSVNPMPRKLGQIVPEP